MYDLSTRRKLFLYKVILKLQIRIYAHQVFRVPFIAKDHMIMLVS